MASSSSLLFLAGPRASRRLRQEGLHAEAIKLVAGAAGGPKWLALSQLDRVLFPHFLAKRQAPLFLLGSSIGTWRFAAVSQQDPAAGIARFEDAYLAQSYSDKPSPMEVSAVSRRVLDSFVSEEDARQILTHPTHRLSIVTARSRGPLAHDHKLVLGLGLGGAIASHLLHRRALHAFFQRTIFFDARNEPPFFAAAAYDSTKVALAPNNLHAALLASGSIPMVMAGVTGIMGAPRGVYRDGGVLDYHMNVPFLDRQADDIVLFPHFGHRIIPSWFDKNLPWRQASAEFMEHVLLLCPSPDFIAKLPYGKIPDRRDFLTFAGRDKERLAYWRQVLDACQRLADEFWEVVERKAIGEVVRPLPLGR